MKQQHNNPVSQLTNPQLCALDQLSTLFTTMALGVEPTMLKSSPPSQFNQCPNFPTHEPFHNHTTTYTHARQQPLMQHPSHMPTPAHPWNTMISSRTQQPKTYGFTLWPMNSAVSLKDSPTNTLILLTPPFSSPSSSQQMTHLCMFCLQLSPSTSRASLYMPNCWRQPH